MIEMARRTKIVATIGPASSSRKILRELVAAGADIFRLNFSHGKREDHARVIKLLREIAEEDNKPISILQDLQGPKIRVGRLEGGSIRISPGDVVTLVTEDILGNHKTIPIDYEGLVEVLKVGCPIMLDDGHLELEVTAIGKDSVEAKVLVGGELKQRKGVNLPGTRLNIPSLTAKDKEDLAFGLEHGVDYVALSFVGTPSDIQVLRDEIRRLKKVEFKIPVIAKLERAEALDNLDEIVHTADGVMVARGDLGVEMPPDEVPIAQKSIIETANRHGRVVITATQMLDSMINNPKPTRAEASDVANAIFDGSDAVMLSGETAVGKYPVQSVRLMASIACTAESNFLKWGHHVDPLDPKTEHDDTYYMTRAARELAHDRNVSTIAVFTKSGRTALLMSKVRPRTPILAFTPELTTYRRLPMYWGVKPYSVAHANTIEEMLEKVENVLMASESITPGEQVVLICGFPIDEVRPSNLALLHTVGQQNKNSS